METAEKKPAENESTKRVIEKVSPPFARACGCGRKTVDKNETICIECGASTRKYEGK